MRGFAMDSRTARVWAMAGVASVAAVLAWLIHRAPAETAPTLAGKAFASSERPPWVLGQPRARFTLIAYADLECPYCRQYWPVLRQLIAEHPEANLQWHHLPLAEHAAAALAAARLAECAGEISGGAGFWAAVDWHYAHSMPGETTRPASISSPRMNSEIQACLRSTRPDAIISRDAVEAARDQVSATPTLRLLDRESGRSLTLPGVLEPDALLSAIDFLASAASETE